MFARLDRNIAGWPLAAALIALAAATSGRGGEPDRAVSDPIALDVASQAAHSFDVGTAHYVFIDTYRLGQSELVPAGWLESDLATAVARGAKQVFVFGTAPVYPVDPSADSVPGQRACEGGKAAANREALRDVVERHRAAYFCVGGRRATS
jgi:hypothetical protein